jgi:hypothetical protein
MKVRQHFSGKRFEIVAVEIANGSCPALEYLAGLKGKSPDTYASMLRQIEYRADNLIMRSSKPLKGDRYKGLFRLEQGGERLCYMYLPGKQGIALLSGYCKTDVEKTEYERARQYMMDLLDEID